MSYDILSDLTKYMSQKLNIPASTRVPTREPKEFITVTRTGEALRLAGIRLILQCRLGVLRMPLHISWPWQ